MTTVWRRSWCGGGVDLDVAWLDRGLHVALLDVCADVCAKNRMSATLGQEMDECHP